MTPPESGIGPDQPSAVPAVQAPPSFGKRLGFLARLAALVWATLALYYTLPLPWLWLRIAVAAAFAASGLEPCG